MHKAEAPRKTGQSCEESMATEAENTAVTQVGGTSEHAAVSEGGVTAPEATARTGKFHSSQLAISSVSPRSLLA